MLHGRLIYGGFEDYRLKAGTAEDIDKLARRQVRVTKEHNDECKKLLTMMGIPVVTVSMTSNAVSPGWQISTAYG